MATSVMHGRRKGQNRGTPEMPIEQPGMRMGEGVDLRQVTVLSKGDWERIQTQLHRKQIEEDRIRRKQAEIDEKKKKSKEMVDTWGNTIIGQRQRKLEARTIREQKEEEEKKLVDLEEAQYQAQQRREAIEKAKTQQYYQTDRVKKFHSALQLTEVLKEREAQIELKRLKDKANIGKDNEYLELERREYEQSIKDDQAKALERIISAQNTRQFQVAQVQEHLKSRDLERREDRKEGEELKKLGIQYHQEKERLENIKKDEKQQLKVDNVKQIRDRDAIRNMQKQQEEDEDEECRIFAAAKRKMMKLRAEKELEIHNEKQKNLDRIRTKLAAQMTQKVSDEDDRIHKAVQEAEEKREKEEVEKELKMRKAMKESADHRHVQLKEAEDKKKELRRQELETIRIRQAADEIFRRNEEEKRVRKREDNENLKNFHFDQTNDRKGKEIGKKQKELALDRANLELIAMEEEQFQEYATKVIEHCEKGGRNVYPLRKAAQTGAGGGVGPKFEGKGGIRPSYMVSDKTGRQMPHYQRDSTEETKDNIYGKAPSKKRLGFVW
ncbi:cilia- and flagella- associated protein 210-like [Mytilus californianus]|uniref:cilia- and flagella- associated protein 210-like n=1 Tax=Mytilus californianus TaxID=6549 RepID=UPI00224745C1|nr:cilia- and flagella- associated protein 210-like [Mytilus californianus]